MAREDDKLSADLKDLTALANNPEGARNALAMLFPKADAVLDTYAPSDYMSAVIRKKERRISVGDIAPVYFRLDPAPISWSRSELDYILALGPELGLQAVEDRVRKYSEDDGIRLRRLFLDFLSASLSENEIFNGDWFRYLMAASPAYVDKRGRRAGDFLYDEGFLPLTRLLFQVFSSKPADERYAIVSEQLDEIYDLSVLADFFRTTVGDTNPKGATSARENQFFGVRTDKLRERLVAKIRLLAETGAIWNAASPARLIWFWWGSTSGDEVREFLSRSIADPVSLRMVLSLVIGKVFSSSGDYERISSGYEQIIDLDRLTASAYELKSRTLDRDDELLVNRYLKAVARSAE